MKKLAVIVVSFLGAASLFAASPAEQQVTEAIKAPGISVVHLWAPWCGNCQSELKSGGGVKTGEDNTNVKFYFFLVWDGGGDGKELFAENEVGNQPNMTVLADPARR